MLFQICSVIFDIHLRWKIKYGRFHQPLSRFHIYLPIKRASSKQRPSNEYHDQISFFIDLNADWWFWLGFMLHLLWFYNWMTNLATTLLCRGDSEIYAYRVSYIYIQMLNICFIRRILLCSMTLNFDRTIRKKLNKSRKVNTNKVHYVQLWCSPFSIMNSLEWLFWNKRSRQTSERARQTHKNRKKYELQIHTQRNIMHETFCFIVLCVTYSFPGIHSLRYSRVGKKMRLW